MSAALQELRHEVESTGAALRSLQEQISRVVVGQTHLVERLILAIVADGHVLIEGLPGLAKTTAVKALSDAIHTQFARIQFTPDLLPADLIGTEIYQPASGTFAVKKGPMFTNLLLADEINRAPAKVQSALLEAMQERQVTIGDQTFPLPEPFLVLATQNPIEQEGTYPLPEAQVDRFLLKLNVGYPTREEEKQIMQRMARGKPAAIEAVLQPQDILSARNVTEQIFVDPKVEDYMVDLVLATREPERYQLRELQSLLEYGASPRATISLARASRVHAFIQGRAFVTPEDVKAIFPDIVRHRLVLSYEADAKGTSADDVVQTILGAVDVP